MTNVSGTIFTKTITGQTLGSTINYAVKFAYAGGLSVTKYVSYVVGNNCALEVTAQSLLDQFSYNNPVNDFVTINSQLEIDKVAIYSMLGTIVSSTNFETNSVDVRNLPKGIYLLAVYSGELKSVKN